MQTIHVKDKSFIFFLSHQEIQQAVERIGAEINTTYNGL